MKRALIIVAIIIALIIIFKILCKYFKWCETMGRPKDEVRKLSYFVMSEFDSPAEFPEDNGKETYSYKNKVYLSGDGLAHMKQSLLLNLDLARNEIENTWNRDNPAQKIVFKINSGHRTPKHNEVVGGVTNSAHINGYAVDISTSGYNEDQKKAILKALYKFGFRRFGIGQNIIHVDSSPTKPNNSVWNYGNGAYPLGGYEIENIAAL